MTPIVVHAHPIHMSVTEIRFSKGGDAVDVTVKVFADDFSTAAARFTKSHLDSGKIIDRSRGYAYLLHNVRFANGPGTIPLRPCGVTRNGETLTFCLRASVQGDLKSLRLANTLLTEIFSDQVNVVQSVNGRRRSSRMFVRGDGWKSI
jgi:hypothetical protein